jgi:hypothetical protein
MWNGVHRHEPYVGMGEDRQGEAQHAKKNEHNVQITVQRLLIVIFVLGCCRKVRGAFDNQLPHIRDGEYVESKAPEDENVWCLLESRLTG